MRQGYMQTIIVQFRPWTCHPDYSRMKWPLTSIISKTTIPLNVLVMFILFLWTRGLKWHATRLYSEYYFTISIFSKRGHDLWDKMLCKKFSSNCIAVNFFFCSYMISKKKKTLKYLLLQLVRGSAYFYHRLTADPQTTSFNVEPSNFSIALLFWAAKTYFFPY